MEEITWVGECNGQLLTQLSAGKRKLRPKRVEFVGWGSRQLIEFLESIGKDTSEKISQYDVTDIINKYVLENNLMHPVKKKRIACDNKLLSLFGRKLISRIKIYDLLEVHYAENQDDSDLDFLYSSDDEQLRSFPSEKRANKKRKVVQAPKSSFAAIVGDNIKLLYLRKSLVQELVKAPDTLESKMLGSFVRIKSDPNDYLQKNSYQLVQVTGVKKGPGTDDFLLQVTNYIKDVPISILSDDNFSQEECEDLHQRIKNGFLKRPTVVEMEEKARSLHEDVAKHWLARELVSLQRLIDRANEKGWRRELFEYLEKRELLQNPEEQCRLLCEVPEVIAEELEVPGKEHADDDKQLENGSFMPSPEAGPETPKRQSDEEQLLRGSLIHSSQAASEIPKILDDRKQPENGFLMSSLQEIPDIPKPVDGKKQQKNGLLMSSLNAAPDVPTFDTAPNGRLPTWVSFAKDSAGDKRVDLVEDGKRPMNAVSQSNSDETSANVEKMIEVSQLPSNRPVIDLNEGFQVPSTTQEIIELSDDEEEGAEGQSCGNQAQAYCDDHDIVNVMWFYNDPQGHTQGPFSLTSLKHWSDADYFPPDFKVWKTGQSPETAVLLNDILYRIFPC